MVMILKGGREGGCMERGNEWVVLFKSYYYDKKRVQVKRVWREN